MSTTTAPTLTQPLRCHNRISEEETRKFALRHIRIAVPHGPAESRTLAAESTQALWRWNTNIISCLAAEWSATITTTRARTQVHQWGVSETVLRGHSNAGDILDAIDTGTPQAKDQILLALLRLAHAGDALAERTVLQAMLPKLCLLTHSVDTQDGALATDRGAVVVEAFLAVVADYPIHRRPRGVAGNLSLDTLHTITTHLRSAPKIHTTPIDPTELSEDLHSDTALGDQPNAQQELQQVLGWASRQQIISHHDADLLAAVFLPDPDTAGGHAAVAQAWGMSSAAVRQRCSRATRRIRDAVQARSSATRPAASYAA